MIAHLDYEPQRACSAAIFGCGFCGHPCPQFERAAEMPPEPAGPSSVAVLRRMDKDADATRFMGWNGLSEGKAPFTNR